MDTLAIDISMTPKRAAKFRELAALPDEGNVLLAIEKVVGALTASDIGEADIRRTRHVKENVYVYRDIARMCDYYGESGQDIVEVNLGDRETAQDG